MAEPLTLFVRITPKSEHFATVRQALLGIIPETRAEPGCRSFVLHDDTGTGGRLYLYEAWNDAAALSAHLAQPYTGSIIASYPEWLAEPIESTKLREII